MTIRPIHHYIRVEALGGMLMIFMALLALIISNSPLVGAYDHFLEMTLSITLNGNGLSKDVLHWINDGLMTVFFLQVGLEIKREMQVGELNTGEKRILPAIAALGGMLVPALIFVIVNWDDAIALKGWATPTATDIAFAIGIASLLGDRIPTGAKILLLAIAVFDDIGAIAIIALFYTSQISFDSLLLAGLVLLVLYLLNRYNVRQISLYIVLGSILWFCVLKSGVHATLSGVALAFAIPEKDPKNPDHDLVWQLEKGLQPWVLFFVLPMFALANAGVSFNGITPGHILGGLPMGIIMGLFFGKQIGIFGFIWLSIKARVAQLPEELSWSTVYGIAILCGIGFTMSLFIGTLAFKHLESYYAAMVRLGVLTASFVSGLAGFLFLYFTHEKPK